MKRNGLSLGVIELLEGRCLLAGLDFTSGEIAATASQDNSWRTGTDCTPMRHQYSYFNSDRGFHSFVLGNDVTDDAVIGFHTNSDSSRMSLNIGGRLDSRKTTYFQGQQGGGWVELASYCSRNDVQSINFSTEPSITSTVTGGVGEPPGYPVRVAYNINYDGDFEVNTDVDPPADAQSHFDLEIQSSSPTVGTVRVADSSLGSFSRRDVVAARVGDTIDTQYSFSASVANSNQFASFEFYPSLTMSLETLPAVELYSFSNPGRWFDAKTDRVSLLYSAAEPFQLTIYGDGEFLESYFVSETEINENPDLALYAGDQISEEPSQLAFSPGVHALVIEPDERLRDKLESMSVGVISVSANIDGYTVASTDFHGVYQAEMESRLVVRSGRGTEDSINIDDSFVSVSSIRGTDTIVLRAARQMPVDMLVVTNDMNDQVRNLTETAAIVIAGDGNDSVQSGRGSDVIIGGLGNDQLDAGDGNDIVLGDAYITELTDLGRFLHDLLEGQLTFQGSFETTGLGNDSILGGIGFDVLIGGYGNDMIDSGDDGSLIFGDGLRVSVGPSEVSLRSIFENEDAPEPQAGSEAKKTRAEKASNLIVQALTLIGLPQFELLGDGQDTISGGEAIDLIFTGNGNNIVQTGGGSADAVIGGDGRDQMDGSMTYINFLVGGAGDDRLTGSMFVGGFGNLLIGDWFDWSGDGISSDIQLEFVDHNIARLKIGPGLTPSGNGNDTLVAASGLDFFFGGNGNGTITGGDLLNVLVGDSFRLDVELELDFQKIWETFVSEGDMIQAITGGFRLPGLADSGSDTITGGDGIDLIIGGDGNDMLQGNAGIVDVIFANGGNDTVVGGAGFNAIVGGEGDDTITGGDDGNVLIGDSFDLISTLGASLDIYALKQGRLVTGTGIVSSGAGNDVVTGGAGFDFIIGGNGNDILSGGDGFNVALGDSIDVGSAETIDLNALVANPIDVLFHPDQFVDRLLETVRLAGSGNDMYVGGASTDIAFGGDGDDTLLGNAGFDVLVGGGGNDWVDGGPGLTLEMGGVLLGGPGDDRIQGGDSNDHLESEAGEDTFHGGAGNDRIYGGDGNDQLFGEEGDDHLYGEDGNDILDGGNGNDVLYGGAGVDQLSGGGGNNFLFQDHVILVPGDSNHDGKFDSRDLIVVFIAGQYEDGIDGNATWETGDWNGDGNVNSSDLIVVFQAGTYAANALPSVVHRSNADWKRLPRPRGLESIGLNEWYFLVHFELSIHL